MNTALAMGMIEALVPADAGLRAISSTLLVGGTILSVGVSLLLWYLVARRGSNIARWVLTALVVIGVVLGVLSGLSGSYPTGLLGALGALNSALQVLAIWCLFRPDAAAWFGSADDADTFA
ncbi:hypothetical protein [Sphingomonas baiyangensis]|uniref:Uncharacterized protein n=1 Tax=Sphingomonas baiyangensis TaxID=2572576 RepID=A0A4V5PUL6_9SPHN|nr:hypothetical protein [Sphingomonas baiyangensis]TKD50718.1 hypothetical protein FBR43_08015 [Sphingomonas baiyangensis]